MVVVNGLLFLFSTFSVKGESLLVGLPGNLNALISAKEAPGLTPTQFFLSLEFFIKLNFIKTAIRLMIDQCLYPKWNLAFATIS